MACGFSDFARILPAETRRLVVEPRQLSYAIGVAKPLSLFVGSPGDTGDSEGFVDRGNGHPLRHTWKCIPNLQISYYKLFIITRYN